MNIYKSSFLFFSQQLDSLRTNRANLKPPQLQMLEQLEKQFSVMQQQQVHMELFKHGGGLCCFSQRSV